MTEEMDFGFQKGPKKDSNASSNMQFGEDAELARQVDSELEKLDGDEKWRDNVIRVSLQNLAAAMDACSDKSDEEENQFSDDSDEDNKLKKSYQDPK